jgi:hypothetical protein
MGEKIKKPVAAPVIQNAMPQGKNTQSPPPFQMKADPIQRQADGATKTAEEIAAKKAQMEADPTVLSPGEEFNPSDKAMVDAALDREGYKSDVKANEGLDLCETNISGGINPYCEDKIKAVNKSYQDLKRTDPAAALAIKNSLQKVGGRVYRVQKENFTNLDKWLKPYGLLGYRRVMVSDHALGCAVDINANQSTKQNDHFTVSPKEKAAIKKAGGTGADLKTDPLLRFVEKIIQKYDADFDLDKTKGVAHLNALNTFPGHLQVYVNTLLNHAEMVPIFDDEKTIKEELKACKTDKKNCKFILDNWNTLKGWDKGTRLDKATDKQSTIQDSSYNPADPKTLDLKGIVDMNATFLQWMLDAGWTWGGDFGRGNKDYMHFQDNAAMEKMKK